MSSNIKCTPCLYSSVSRPLSNVGTLKYFAVYINLFIVCIYGMQISADSLTHSESVSPGWNGEEANLKVRGRETKQMDVSSHGTVRITTLPTVSTKSGITLGSAVEYTERTDGTLSLVARVTCWEQRVFRIDNVLWQTNRLNRFRELGSAFGV
jgi:hypothetical protein